MLLRVICGAISKRHDMAKCGGFQTDLCCSALSKYTQDVFDQCRTLIVCCFGVLVPAPAPSTNFSTYSVNYMNDVCRALEESCSEVELSQEEAIINDIFPPKVSRARQGYTVGQISITIKPTSGFLNHRVNYYHTP